MLGASTSGRRLNEPAACGGSANDQLNGDRPMYWSAVQRAHDPIGQDLKRDIRQLLLGLAYGRKADPRETGHEHVVEPDHRELVRHAYPKPVGRFEKLDGRVVISREHGSDPLAENADNLLIAEVGQVAVPMENHRLKARPPHDVLVT